MIYINIITIVIVVSEKKQGTRAAHLVTNLLTSAFKILYDKFWYFFIKRTNHDLPLK